MSIKLNVNGKVMEADVDPDTPLLWTLRDALGISGRSSAAAWPSAAPARSISTAWPSAAA